MALRDQVRARAGDRCEYCHLNQKDTVLPHGLDHIRAQKHEGATTLENLCWACAYCNAAKGPNIAGYDPITGQLKSFIQSTVARLDRTFRMENSNAGRKNRVRPRNCAGA